MIKITEELKNECFDFLYALRRASATNMYGARPYMQEAFPQLNEAQCIEILVQWMQEFDISRA